MAHELATQPASLFDKASLRKTNKAALAQILANKVSLLYEQPEGIKVIDCGYLLHGVVWPRPPSYGDISQMYVDHVIQKYGESSVLVCDGYEGPPSTKSQEHMRRSLKNSSPDILFSEITPSQLQKQVMSDQINQGSC